ncbi:MAG: 3-hydroxyacyl-CoA dehydrogenase/enoyl-CoA hydratase/3-hydroxybutyryl-CoA epimerase [Myxococcota bacterium]|jgi:3-hydroxyacyl-CoA dehydrogenase/enoyl-CoA hydratase/3-hydroxybutyryl-CoA epimerase
MQTIRVEVGADGVAVLTIDCPGKPMNVLDESFGDDLSAAIERVASDDAIRGAVVASGKSTFLAGADLKWLSQLAFGDRPPVGEFADAIGRFSRALRRLETCGKPFVAAINGTALGGGLELALACHHRICTDDPRALLGLPEASVGLLPGAGGTQRLPRLIGIKAALPLMLEGRNVGPAKALELGVVHAVLPAAELVEAAREWVIGGGAAVQPWDVRGFKVPGGAGGMDPRIVPLFMGANAMAQDKSLHNYPAVEAILSCVYEGTQVPMDAGLSIENQYFTKLFYDPVAGNMIRSLFVFKGRADKLARRPADVPRRKVTRLGVLGAGMMGAGIAYSAAKAGITVVLIDRDLASAERGKAYSAKIEGKRLAKGRTSQAKLDALLARIRPTTDYAELTGCELVIEAVFENRQIKADVTARAEAVLADDAVFATNTSTLPITGLATASCRPHRFVGLHFFSPVDKMPLVELIVGEQTGDEAVAWGLDFVRQIRKTPIVVNDSRGFYTSRTCGAYLNEGQTMLLEGVTPALIENAGRLAGMPVGPLALADEIGLDLGVKIRDQTKADLGDAFEDGSGFAVLAAMTELGRVGRKAGRGFYDYSDQGKRLWAGLSEIYPRAAEQPAVEVLQQRLLGVQALEAARCMDEGVLRAAEDADVGAILGLGYPPYTGGPLAYIDMEGSAEFVARCDAFVTAYGPRFSPPKGLRALAASGARWHS